MDAATNLGDIYMLAFISAKKDQDRKEATRLLREIRDNAALRQQMIAKGKRRSSAFSWKHSGELLKRFLDDERMLAVEP